ncbi:aldehyde dehydrogenase [Arthrobacter sp. W4I7]|uniref:aldehyde dehydrogenase family protein n=1 Tax=Arthrobacter sp. W4I7 TaxID=3042296 RepID=UPI0027861E94|nr:aldehyde dehydrogenase family protein [Arthrobacter sp. W4I7]MDQ0691337.1 aldehyde dehydrogenase (NAD+) [Arthrobacter sp. W4I7]
MPLLTPPVGNLPDTSLIIGDTRVSDSSGGTHPHLYAGNGALTSEVPMAGPVEVDRAVSAARAAQPGWERMPPPQRRKLLNAFADLIERDADLLTDLAIIDTGTPRVQAQRGGMVTAELFRYNAGWTDRLEGSVLPTWPAAALDYAVPRAYGVVAIIVPWNGPSISAGMTVAPALAAGNTVVLKPPELAPYAVLHLGKLALEAGIPPGVLNVIPGGPEGGNALVSHAGIDKVHFTGSGPTAQRILAAVIPHMTPVGLELGGKSASVVFDDIDTSIVPSLLHGIITLSGQGCINPTRLIVQDNIYEEFVAIATQTMAAIPMGDPNDVNTVMGPVVNDAACQRILGMIDRADSEGARLTTGGGRLGGELADGYFIEPTILADVDNSSYIAQNEVFGPVLSILRFSDEADAIAMANDSEFGLAGYVYTNNLKRAHRVADQLDVGNVWVNGFAGIPASAPFGGNKMSGVGRLGGKWGIEEFTRMRNVWVGL